MSITATIYELSSEPLNVEERTKDYELAHFFHYQNPWWVGDGCPEPIDEDDRIYCIDTLKDSLPSGYSLVGEKITLVNLLVTTIYKLRILPHLLQIPVHRVARRKRIRIRIIMTLNDNIVIFQ